eukprot:755855-Hanusia_phi.AAC.2
MKTVQDKDVVCAVCQEEFPVNGKAKFFSSAISSTTTLHIMTHLQHTTSTCQIASSPAQLDHFLQMMPCGHPFHYDCLMEWLERKNRQVGGEAEINPHSSSSCPICRYSLPSEQVAFDLAEDLVTSCPCPS